MSGPLIMTGVAPDDWPTFLEAKYPVDLRRRLADVSVPTLVFHGALDKMSSDPRREAATFQSDLPDAVLVDFHDAGHLPLRTRPGVVADVLDAFLDRTTPHLAGTGVHAAR
jgi:pimeloyl-ACP methyl ester carboxylesterase